jgi:rSAM/selenodomain-associated transferase 1
LSTLIVFCREPIPGETKTRLIPKMGAANAAALADAFVCDALAKAAAIGPGRLVIAAGAPGDIRQSKYFVRIARRFHADLIDQGRGSLGARMKRAIEPYAPDGVLLIGTDTPSLPLALLERSFSALRSSRIVLAPSLDGGYYAVGVRGQSPPIFSGIRWGRRTVLQETILRLKKARLGYRLGPAWYDVDRWSDVMLLAAHLRTFPRIASSACPATARFLRRLGVLGGPR